MELIIAIDPGKYTGWAKFDSSDSRPTHFGVIDKESEIWNFISTEAPDIWVVENYRIRPPSKHGWSHQWDSAFALQVIGAIKARSHLTGAEMILQEPAIKPVAYKWMGMDVPSKSNKFNHAYDAIAHGSYYLWKGGYVARTP